MERKNDNILFKMSEMQIAFDLLCPECRKNLADLFKMWREKRDENLERLQSMAERPTEKEIERTIDEQIEKQIEKSDD